MKTRCEEPDVEAKRREEEEEAVASILEEVAEKIDPVHTFENSVMCQSMTGTWRVLT